MSVGISRRGQVALLTKALNDSTNYAWNTAVLDSSNVLPLIGVPTLTQENDRFDRNPSGPFGGFLPPLTGGFRCAFQLVAELVGSGTAGTAPQVDGLLKMCGFTRADANGAAAIIQNIRRVLGNGTGVPVIAGTYGGTLSGIVSIQITGKSESTDNTVNFIASVSYADGAGDTDGADDQTGNSAVTLAGGSDLDGITVNFGNINTQSVYDSYEIGDTFVFSIVGSTTVNNEYTLQNTSSFLADLAGFFDDERLVRIANAAASLSIATTDNGGPLRLTADGRGEHQGFGNNNLFTTFPFPEEPPLIFQGPGTALELGGVGVGCSANFSINMNSNVVDRRCHSRASGIIGAQITDNAPEVTFDPEMAAFAAYNGSAPYAGAGFFSKAFESGNAGLLELELGNVAGNRCKVIIPSFSVTTATAGDREGLLITEVTGVAARPAASDPTYGFAQVILRFD